MKIYILRKLITDLKNPIIKNEYITKSVTVKDLITEMVIRITRNIYLQIIL